MKKTAFLIMIITLASKFLGFGRDVVLSYFFGASQISDAYLISLTVPGVIFGFIGTGIVTAYIPMQSRVMHEEGDAAASRFTSNFSNIILFLITIILSISLVFTEPIIKLFALGFSGETLKLTVDFTRITLFGMYFTALISIFSGYLQIKKNYIIPALIGFPLNIIVIISIFIAADGNYIVLAIGSVLAAFAQFGLMIPFIKKERFNYSLHLNFQDDRIKKTLFIALPVIMGTSVNQINVLVDRTLASSLAIGGISALNYANRLNLFIQGLFVTSIITVMYPVISSYASKQNYEGIMKTLMESINIITIMVLPLTVGAMIFSNEVVTLLFGRGAFDGAAIKMTSTSLFYYALGMLSFGLREVLARGFYSMQNTKTPMINAAIGLSINIVLNIILSRYMGIGGLALATSIAATITTILLFSSLRKRIGPFGIKKYSFLLVKISLSSLIMGFIAYLCNNILTSYLSQNSALVLSIGVGAFSYFIIIYLMKIEDVDVIAKLIKNKLAKKEY